LFSNPRRFRTQNTHNADSWDEFVDCIENKGGFVMAHWDGSDEAETAIQQKTKATIRCIPLEPDEEPGQCVLTGNPSPRRVVFARSY
jgi:prolyl-tRNA synthetase